jgi:hypothetical protein
LIPTDKGKPINGGGEITYWGLPLHGLVRSGTLTLPNSSTVSYTQPGGKGSVVVVKNPALAGLPDVMPLGAYDAAQGFSWLTFAILAGTNKQIAGQNIGEYAFIFVDHRHRPWKIEAYPNISGDIVIRVVKRFGLFGSDPVSWIENRVIYTGDFNYQGIALESIGGDDVCQNNNGSSVLFNFRKQSGRLGTLYDITRIVELNLSTSDTYPGSPNDLTFNVSFSDRIGINDVVKITNTSYGSSSETGDPCNYVEVTVAEYTYDTRLPAFCGSSAWEPGTYVEHGVVNTTSAFDNDSTTYGSLERYDIIVKIYYDYSDNEVVVKVVSALADDIEYIESCNASFAAEIQETAVVADNGADDGRGNPCSSPAQFTYFVTYTGGYSYSSIRTSVSRYYGGLYINDVAVVEWESSSTQVTTESAGQDASFSDSGTWTEGSADPKPAEYYTAAGWSQSWFAGQIKTIPYGTPYYSSNVDNSTSGHIDGDTTYNVVFPASYHYVRDYANNIFSLVLLSDAYDEGDPGAPAYYGQWGLWAAGSKEITGQIADKNFYATVNPVDMTVTIDQTTPSHYV